MDWYGLVSVGMEWVGMRWYWLERGALSKQVLDWYGLVMFGRGWVDPPPMEECWVGGGGASRAKNNFCKKA